MNQPHPEINTIELVATYHHHHQKGNKIVRGSRFESRFSVEEKAPQLLANDLIIKKKKEGEGEVGEEEIYIYVNLFQIKRYETKTGNYCNR